MVTSPYSPEGNYIDVSAFAAGSAVKDPYTRKNLPGALRRMNSASQNFPHHLGMLRERMLHPTEYELAVNYFLEEFAGDVAFVRASDPEQMPHLVAVLNIVVSKAMGRHVEIENTLVSYLRGHRFVHGNAQADGRVMLFFYFEDADTGLLMLIPGIRGQMEVARFHLKGGLPDPRWN